LSGIERTDANALNWVRAHAPEGRPNRVDRADAMVWAMTELFEKEQGPPRVRVL
jgi:phage terminase large subunit-like protein